MERAAEEEEKEATYSTQTKQAPPNKKTSSLFFPKGGTTRVVVYNIDRRGFWNIILSSKLPTAAGFVHWEERFYLAGGYCQLEYRRSLLGITEEGVLRKLAAMPTAKGFFPMVCDEGGRLITVAGLGNQEKLE